MESFSIWNLIKSWYAYKDFWIIGIPITVAIFMYCTNWLYYWLNRKQFIAIGKLDGVAGNGPYTKYKHNKYYYKGHTQGTKEWRMNNLLHNRKRI